MTATDELRCMLDERGVEWRDDSSIYGTRRTVWTADGVTYVAVEVSGRLKVSGYLAPEQAIAVTLGRRKCKNVHEPPKDTTFWPAPHFKCSVCGKAHVSMDYVYFCPNCGAEVVDE